MIASHIENFTLHLLMILQMKEEVIAMYRQRNRCI